MAITSFTISQATPTTFLPPPLRSFQPPLLHPPLPPSLAPLRRHSPNKTRSTISTSCSLSHLATHTLHSTHIALPLALIDAAGSGPNGMSVGLAVAGGGLIAVLATVLSLADPENRRRQQAEASGGDEKEVVRNYFNTAGFDRWKRIYGEADDVNDVQLDIRKGHAQTVDKVLKILKDGGLEGVTVCDAGCGTGSLAIPLALEGAMVSASDISSSMAAEAERRATEAIASASVSSSAKPITPPRFEAKDLESLEGTYHTVACIDVLIHYPQEKMSEMIEHLVSLAEKRLIVTFAPKTLSMVILKRIGELFPGPSKATRAYLHAEDDVEAALKSAGWVVRRRDMTSTKFYYSRLFEAVPEAN